MKVLPDGTLIVNDCASTLFINAINGVLLYNISNWEIFSVTPNYLYSAKETTVAQMDHKGNILKLYETNYIIQDVVVDEDELIYITGSVGKRVALITYTTAGEMAWIKKLDTKIEVNDLYIIVTGDSSLLWVGSGEFGIHFTAPNCGYGSCDTELFICKCNNGYIGHDCLKEKSNSNATTTFIIISIFIIIIIIVITVLIYLYIIKKRTKRTKGDTYAVLTDF